MSDARIAVRRAEADDAPTVARLLHEFNTEFDEPSPGVEALTGRLRQMLAAGEIVVLLAAEGQAGLAQLRFLRTPWSEALTVYLEELYVVPPRRGEGIGRALLGAATATAREGGADHIDLNTSETDRAARSLYESAGFTNREGSPDGPSMLYYERKL